MSVNYQGIGGVGIELTQQDMPVSTESEEKLIERSCPIGSIK